MCIYIQFFIDAHYETERGKDGSTWCICSILRVCARVFHGIQRSPARARGMAIPFPTALFSLAYVLRCQHVARARCKDALFFALVAGMAALCVAGSDIAPHYKPRTRALRQRIREWHITVPQ